MYIVILLRVKIKNFKDKCNVNSRNVYTKMEIVKKYNYRYENEGYIFFSTHNKNKTLK